MVCGFLLLLSLGCINDTEVAQQRELTYFDIKGYFEGEVSRLNKVKPTISKSVEVNDSLERKQLKIADWQKELSIFSDADINRASWKGLFTVSKQQGSERYVSDNEKVPVKEIQITFDQKHLKSLLIIVKNSNSLYTSQDSLFYYPDSLYRVKKIQHIKLLKEKQYEISGRF